MCRTYDSATQTQGHNLKSCDLPLNFVSALYLRNKTELVSLYFMQMFLLVRKCAESMTQLQRLKVKVTVQGQKDLPLNLCLLHIS